MLEMGTHLPPDMVCYRWYLTKIGARCLLAFSLELQADADSGAGFRGAEVS